MPDFIFFLFLIVLLASSVFVYRFHGKKEFAKFDIVQFIYSFVVAPVVFVWFKTFMYGLMQSDLGQGLSPRTIFMFDTAFSVYFLYVFAFIVIHSLTKSFQLQTEKDPLYDLFHHSEYFHLWLTHLVTYVGAMTIVAFFAGFNVFFPLSLELGRIGFYSSIFLAIICGALFFVALWIADPKQDGANFMRIMKLIAAVLFIILVGVYFVFNPAFNSQYLFFWFGLFSFASVVSCSAFAYKSVKAKNFFERFVEKHSNNQSFKNIQLFRKK